MSFFARITAVLTAGLLLSGCGTVKYAADSFGNAIDYVFAPGPTETQQMAGTDRELTLPAPRNGSIPLEPPMQTPASAPDYASSLSRPGVNTYGMDSAAGAYATPDGGMAAPRDSSVTVYSLDEVYGSSVYPQGAAPQQQQQRTWYQLQPGAPPVDKSPWSGRSGSAAPNTIQFNHGVTSLNGEGKEKAALFARSYSTGSGATVQVDGHASLRTESHDPVTSRLVNLKVSMDRALSVSKELIRDGVPPEAIRTTGWGDTRPSFDEASSRRVEMGVVGSY